MRESSLEHQNFSENRELFERFIREEEAMFASAGMARGDDSDRLAMYRLTTHIALEFASGTNE